MTDLRSLVKRWNDASLRQLATLREPPRSSPWPLVAMLAIGLVAGAIGSYAVTQRSQITRFVRSARMARGEALAEFDGVDIAKPIAVTSHRSNHRRKAAVEVTS